MIWDLDLIEQEIRRDSVLDFYISRNGSSSRSIRNLFILERVTVNCVSLT